MKVNIVVAGKYHSEMLFKHLEKNGIEDVKIYSSSPKFKFDKEVQKSVVFVPKLFQIIRKIFNINTPRWTKYLDAVLFDFFISVIMRKCDVLYGWAGDSLLCGIKTKKSGGAYVLDRACPHCIFQNDLLEEEAKKLDLEFTRSNQMEIKSIKEYKISDYIVVPSEYSFNSFKDRDINMNKIVKIPLEGKNSLPKEKVFNIQDKELFVVGVLGGSLLRKGIIYLLRAWDKMQLSNSKLLIKAKKSDINLTAEIDEIINRNKNIEFIGYIQNINDYYQGCDIFCLPSIDEGFGMVVPEAMANSLPVIVTKHVGASELVKDSVNGFIINPFSDTEIREKILYFYENRDIIESMGKESYRIYKTYLNSDKTYEYAIQSFFNQLILRAQN